jgi:hypothetical protein
MGHQIYRHCFDVGMLVPFAQLSIGRHIASANDVQVTPTGYAVSARLEQLFPHPCCRCPKKNNIPPYVVSLTLLVQPVWIERQVASGKKFMHIICLPNKMTTHHGHTITSPLTHLARSVSQRGLCLYSSVCLFGFEETSS